VGHRKPCRGFIELGLTRPAWAGLQFSGQAVTSLLVSLGPLNNTMVIIDLNKPWIISNSGELSDLEHLPTKTEYI